MVPDSQAYVTVDTVKNVIAKLPCGKAGNDDNVVYEHFKHCKDIISPVLSNMFTYMLRCGYIPTEMKRGNIITLHKGGKKRKDEPCNYRAITLSSSLLKMYEACVLERCESSIIDKLSKQQCGFQKGLGCIMTSFTVRECLHFAREYSSKVYLCYLDGRQAFDRVWHHGLLLKLEELKIDETSLIAFKELLSCSRSCVKNQGLVSTDFPILQGCPQGRKCSPIMYLVFIDGLIKQLEASRQGFCKFDVNMNSPTVADDMVLVSLSKSGMDSMIEMCWQYSLKWRYFYNPDKCKVLVFNETPGLVPNRYFVLGNHRLSECDTYTHLGIPTDRFLSCKNNIRDAGHKHT